MSPRRHLPNSRLAVVGLAATAVLVPAGLAVPALAGTAPAAPPAAAAAAAPRPTSAWKPTACFPALPPGTVQELKVRCGYVTVPLRHEKPSAGTIQLAVAVVPAQSTRARKPDPVFLLTGGPGQPTVGLAPLILGQLGDIGFGALHVDHDLVLADQRGNGYSKPSLSCLPYADPKAPDGGLTACRKALGRITDLSAYSTVQNAADLESVRRALGYGAVDLYGVSYGSQLGQEAVRGTPSWVRSAALASPVPAGVHWFTQQPRWYQRALDLVYKGCAAQTSCTRSWGNVRAKLDRLTARLEKKPLLVPISPDRHGKPRSVPLTVDGFDDLLYQGLYSAQGVAYAPALIATLDAGDTSVVAARLDTPDVDPGPVDPGTLDSDGQHSSLICAEQVAYSRAAEVAAAAKGTQPLVARHFAPGVAGAFQACKLWNVPKGPAQSQRPVVSSTRTLVVAGQHDPVTPPAFGSVMVKTLGKGRLITIEGVGHSPLENAGACANDILQPFVANPAGRFSAPCASNPVHYITAADLQRPESSPKAVAKRIAAEQLLTRVPTVSKRLAPGRR